MTSKEIVREIMDRQNMRIADLAGRLGIGSSTLCERLSPKKSNNLTIKTLSEMLRQLDFEVVIMPRGKAGRFNDAYIVDEREIKPKEE